MESLSGPYNLFEFGNLDGLYQPIRNSARVKYTCFDVSKQYLILGANSGSLYIFQRDPLQYIRVLSHKDGSLANACIAPNETYFAFATSKGVVVVIKHNIGNGRTKTPSQSPQYLHISREHQGAVVTSVVWNDSSSRFFVGDHTGKVTSVNIVTKKTFFKVPTCLIVKLDSQIVQMDYCLGKLLVSTLTSCYLCDTIKEQYSQIGTKPRDGEFGACFYTNLRTQICTIYAARPGSRMWEVDFEGSVLCTHQFKKNLAQAPVPLISICDPFLPPSADSKWLPQSLNFPKLNVFGDRFLLTRVKEGLYLFDPTSMSLVMWTAFANEILDFRKCHKEVYLWLADGRLRHFQLLTIERGIHKLLSDGFYRLAACVCRYNGPLVTSSRARQWLPRRALEGLAARMKECGEHDLWQSIEKLVSRLEDPVPSRKEGVYDRALNMYKIESGIYVVNRPGDDQEGRFQRNASTSPQELAPSVKETRSPQRKSSVNSERSGRTQHVDPYIQTQSQVTPVSSSPSFSTLNGSVCHLDVDSQQLALPMLMSCPANVFWDVDPLYTYESLALLKPNVSFTDLKNSLSSKYNSGKERILSKMSVIEDRLKSVALDGPQELLDVQDRNQDSEQLLQHLAFEDHKESESVVCQKGFEKTRNSILKPWVEDKAELGTATKKAWEKVQDPTIFSDATKLQEILCEWVAALLDTQEYTYQSFAKNLSQIHASMPEMTYSKSCATFQEIHNGHRNGVEVTPSLQEKQQIRRLNGSRRRRLSCPNILDAVNTTVENPISNNDLAHSEARVCRRISETENEEQFASEMPENDTNERMGPVSLNDVFWWQDFYVHVRDHMLTEATCWMCTPTPRVLNPWDFDWETTEQMSRLAMMCYKTRTFGRITVYCEQFANWTRMESLDPDASEAPCITMDTCPLDHARAIFVRQFFHLLNVREVYSNLHHSAGPSFMSWEAVVSGICAVVQNGMLSSNYEKKAVLQPFYPLLAALRCHKEDVNTIIGKLVSSRVLCPRDILYVNNMRPDLDLFLLYMDALHRSIHTSFSAVPPERAQVLDDYSNYVNMCQDSIVHVAWVRLLLQDGTVPQPCQIKCECGRPKMWSHLFPWKRKTLLLKILKLNAATRETCLELCKQFGFWIGYLHLCYELELCNEMFTIIIQLGHTDLLLKEPSNVDFLPKTHEEWEAFYNIMVQELKNKPHCCPIRSLGGDSSSAKEFGVDQKLLTFENVARLQLKCSSAETVLQMISDVNQKLPEVRYSAGFYHRCIVTSLCSPEYRDLMGKCLEREFTVDENKRPQIYTLPSKGRSPGSRKPSRLEHLEGNWGVPIDLKSRCPMCAFPLAMLLKSSSSEGIRVFPCGHGFHSQCMGERYCILCTNLTATVHPSL